MGRRDDGTTGRRDDGTRSVAIRLGAGTRDRVYYHLEWAGRGCRIGPCWPRLPRAFGPRADRMEERDSGVAVGTLVHTPEGGRTAHELTSGDTIWSFDNESCQWRLAAIRNVAVELVKADMSYLRVAGVVIGLGCCQLVLAEGRSSLEPSDDGRAEVRPVTRSGSWVQAKDLQPGNRVLSISGPLLVEGNAFQQGKLVRLAELETSALHNYAVGLCGLLIHNRNPTLVAGQSHTLTVQATGTWYQLTLPPIDQDHVFLGVLHAAIPSFDGLHHLAGAIAIQQGVPIAVPGHTVTEPTPGGGHVLRVVDLRITPLHAASADAPFDARVELIDPGTNAVLASKPRSTFFPSNWTRAQVIQAIYESLIHYVERTGLPPIGAGLHDYTDAGVRMRLHVAGNGGIPTRIISGYPHGAQLQVTAAQAPQ